MTFDANLKAVTQSALLPKAVDTISTGNVHLARTFGDNMKSWKGETMDFSVITTAGSQGKAFSGLEHFSTAGTDTKQRASIDMRAYTIPVVLSGMEIAANNSSDRSIDLMAEAIEESTNEALEDIGGYLYGDGTGTSNKEFLGLDAIIDDGGEVATYAGLSRSTYTTLKANETDVGGALTLAGMATMFDSCEVGSDAPTIIYTTPTIWSAYEALLQPFNSANYDASARRGRITGHGFESGGLMAEGGFKGLGFRGIPVASDEKCTTQKMFFVNERHIGFYAVSPSKYKVLGYEPIMTGDNKQIEGVYEGSDVKASGFGWSGFKVPDDQFGVVGHIVLLGNYFSKNPNRHGVLNTITS